MRIIHALIILLLLSSISPAQVTSRIAFTKLNPLTSDFDIFVAELNENLKVVRTYNVSNVIGADSHPSWSPDGSKIAYISQRHGKWMSIYITDYLGRNTRRFSSEILGRSWGFPGWSPDGKKIAFAYEPKDNDRERGIYLIDIDGRNLRKLVGIPFGSLGSCKWSPDGKKILVHSVELYVIDVETGQYKMICDGADGADWSEKGILYSRSRFRSIFIADENGNILKRYELPDFKFIDEPSYSPDLGKVLFVGRKGNTWGLHILDLKTGKVKSL